MKRALAAIVLAGLACGSREPRRVAWVTDEAAAFATARAQHRGVMIDFAATWSVPCDELERNLAEPTVRAAITESFVPLKVDVSNGTEADEAIRARYGASTLPAIVFVDADGHVLARVDRLVEPAELLATMRPAQARLR